MPEISVVVPAYNAEKYISEAIESILNQTYKDFEFIIINDGSTDKTEEIILSYKDERIVYLKNEKNMGIVYTLNRGLDAAQGEYIARMDSDDISLPTRFEEQLKYLEKHPDIAVLGTGVNVFGEDIESHVKILSANPQNAKAELFFRSSLAHPTVIIRKEILDKYNLRYEEEYAGMEDFVLWWRISEYAKIASLPKPFLNYRRHKSQITATINPQKVQKAKNFLWERISVFNVDFLQEEFDALFKYRAGYYDSITLEDTKNLVLLFKKLLSSNKKTKFFNQYYFKKTLGFALIRSIEFLNLSRAEKNAFYLSAFKQKVLSFELFAKITLREFLKR